MSAGLLDRVVVPVANEEDTEATCRAIEPYLDDIGEILLVHVVEQTEGFMDHTSPEALEEDARGFLTMARENLGQEAVTSVEVRFGTDVSEEIAGFVRDEEATAVLFHPRQKGLLARLVDGADQERLVRASPVPVVALPGPAA